MQKAFSFIFISLCLYENPFYPITHLLPWPLEAAFHSSVEGPHTRTSCEWMRGCMDGWMKNTCNFVFSFTEDGEPRRAHTQLTGTIPSCWSSAFAFQPFTIWYKREEAIKILLKGIWPRSHFCRRKNRNLHTSSTQRQFDDSVLRFLRSGSLKLLHFIRTIFIYCLWIKRFIFWELISVEYETYKMFS